MKKSTLKFLSKLSIIILCILGLTELGLALWTVFDRRYKILAYNLADVGYIDLWILRYLSLCLFASSIITLVMCLILIWGLCSAHVLLFIASTMIVLILIGEFTIAILTFTSKYQIQITLMEQLPKLVITYRQGTDERAKRALDILQYTFRCCGSDGRLSFQNNVPLSCNMFYIGCLTRTMFFLDACLDALGFILLIFSLIKFFIILFFYSFLCLFKQYRDKYSKKNHHQHFDDSSLMHHSSSFDSSSTDNLSRKYPIKNQDENQQILSNEYETTIVSPSSTYQQHIQNNIPTYYEQNISRKLSSISERTEKTETDESESDLSRRTKRKPLIITNQQKKYSPAVAIRKNRKRIIREDDNDSGVEYSSSEKSFDDHNNQQKIKSPTNLNFSKVFVTSISQIQPTNEELKQSLTKSISDDINMTPKSILKKFNQQSSSLDHTPPNQRKVSSIYSTKLSSAPKPIPRTYLKQLKQDESLF